MCHPELDEGRHISLESWFVGLTMTPLSMTKSNLLIADDSPEKIRMLRHFLKKAAWTGGIVIAHTTEEAMQLIDSEPIGFGLIDYYMPSKNGPAIIAYLKQKNPAAHIALVSSSDSKENADEAAQAGAEVCLCTTYEADEVERDMMDLLGRWRSQ